MKKLLIVNNNLHIGGVQKALVHLLWHIRTRYEVTLLLFYPGGELLKELPPDIRVLTVDTAYRYLGMTGSDAQKRVSDMLGRTFFAGITRLFGRKTALWLMAPGQRALTGYDVAIAYLHDAGERLFYGGCNTFVLQHVEAAKKIAFLHCDYSACGADTAANARQYARFDAIAACSQGCADSFLRANPALRERVRVVPNCHRFEAVREMAAQAPITLDPTCFNVVTVARLGKEKGVERALEALKSLNLPRDRLHYYVVGDGVQRSSLQRQIITYGLADTVTLCGALTNPYGYIRAADLLLIPSLSEAAPLVIGEAACLGTPILSTATSSAQEMIVQKGWGFVCENTVEGLTASLNRLLEEPGLLRETARTLADAVFEDRTAVEAFDRILG